jgi:glycosyltransferase involved in cell wall biosynthesis
LKKDINKPRLLAIGITSNEIVTGLSVAFDTFIEGLKEHSVEFVLIDAGVGMSINKTGVFSFSRMVGVFSVLFRFLFYLKRSDIVYVTMGCSMLGFMRDFFIILMVNIFNRKLVFHLHGGGYYDFYHGSSTCLKFIIRRALNSVNKIIILGELLRNQFGFLSSDYGPEIVVVPNGLSSKAKSIQRYKKISKGEPLRFLYLSNMIASKGYLQVLEACRILKAKKINFTCDFAGEFMGVGSLSDKTSPAIARNNFFELIARYKLNNEVRYHGVVKGQTKEDLFLGTHVFILPTLYGGEGQPISIIEALSYGIPVVATRFRGIPEQIKDGYNGILIDVPNPTNIVEALHLIISNSDYYSNMSRQAYKSYKEKFTREQYLERLISVVMST